MIGRIAIITGASSGIGLAIAMNFIEKGFCVMLNAREESALKDVAEGINAGCKERKADYCCGDVCQSDTTLRCIHQCIETWGRGPDIFVAAAGRGLPGTLINSDSEQWSSLIDTNIKGLMYQLKAASQQMMSLSEESSDFVSNPKDIIVIGSTIGRNVSPFNSVYGSTKFAAHGLTEALRRQLAPKGIRVSLIEPGLVKTNFQSSAGYDQQWFSKYAEEVGPVLVADDVAAVIGFLVSLPGNVHLDNVSIRPTRQPYP